MKILLSLMFGLFLIIALLSLVLSLSSRKQPELGLLNGRLRPCPATPNCVCSEPPVAVSFIPPLAYSIAHADAWHSVRQAVVETGGVLINEQDDYLHARYVTPLLRYIDDVELRIDEHAHLIHIRSASRVGHADFGVNRRRVSRIWSAFDRQIGVAGNSRSN